MKLWVKLLVTFSILVVLSIPSFFVYTRFCIDVYQIQGDALIYKNIVYSRSDEFNHDEDLGNMIGIAKAGKRTATDYIWPIWVIEYKNDREHQRILLRGLMDTGTVYHKN
ncbi:MAG: hypothetical protein H7Y41_07085 [Hyphomonadaceae bacterium]|nr:hypothetical protein [Clostridia bacterium]